MKHFLTQCHSKKEELLNRRWNDQTFNTRITNLMMTRWRCGAGYSSKDAVWYGLVNGDGQSSKWKL